jgi:predicted SAM-dependent methyltransferase
MKSIKQFFRRILSCLAPWRFWESCRFEFRMCLLRIFHRRMKLTVPIGEALVNIGAGKVGRDGWINLDAFDWKNVAFTCDCRTIVPLPDASARGIFTEHFLEHVDYDDELPEFLRECYRVLRPGGTLRIVVPDGERYLRAYCETGWAGISKLRQIRPDGTDPYLAVPVKTKMELVNVVFRQFGEHKFAYDFETLALKLGEFGFVQIEQAVAGVSRDPIMAIDFSIRIHESLYVEASKPTLVP